MAVDLKWLNSNRNKSKRSIAAEKRLAEEVGGRRVRQSGAARWSKWEKTTEGADVTRPGFRIEQKQTEKGSLSIKREWLEKITSSARSTLQRPAVVITFEAETMHGSPQEWVLIPLDLFKIFLKRMDQEKIESLPPKGSEK